MISKLLRPCGWKEDKFRARMLMDDFEAQVSTHKIDYVKGRVAFDFEWNAKEQTFDRDLATFRGFFEYGRISVGVILTRDSSLASYLGRLGYALNLDGTVERNKRGIAKKVKGKYGASTTHSEKLLQRLRGGRSGGCPVLAMGITERLRKPVP